ncbi:palmitoyltransferase ZDHHC23-B [Cylas formicarius]|uniref:palmitoyltransferase ZDHHC23-B n=1 Tax=Cylas formicarius TaxID=197179 RepID=UPI002958CC0D|nr:palmitoyltransferase ZDHHC23-B [Cylas formicarius]
MLKFKNIKCENRIFGMVATFQDRLRPRYLTFDGFLPVIILPSFLLVASLSFWWTIFSFTTLTIFFVLIFAVFIKLIPKTKFFLTWTLTSLTLLYFIFEFVVIPFLEILLEENLFLSVLIFGFVICLYLVKSRANELISYGEGDPETNIFGKDISRFYTCRICDSKIPDKDHHCIWFDCCISRHNQCLFILTLVFGIAALLYSSNLTLTSVCHPFEFYKTILLPDDCSDVYFQFELGLSFVSALYSIFLANFMVIILLQQVILVSIGISTTEWRKLPCASKLCLGLNAKRSYHKGFFKNWAQIICCLKNYYSTANRVA